jgi:hypothetical protein
MKGVSNMSSGSNRFIRRLAIVACCGLLATSLIWAQGTGTEPAHPGDQEFIGTKKCAACHFDQFIKWKKTKHSKSFDLLPAKYQADEKCLKCHTTGHGEPTGFKTAADADLKGTSCEACHGPGSKHAEASKAFANKKPTPEQEKIARDSIWKVLPQNVCISCHMVQGHHDSMTPAELRKP